MTVALVVAYFVIIILVAVLLEFLARRKKSNSTAEGFSTAKNTMGVLAAFGLMVGNVIGGGYVIGTPGGVVSNGTFYMWPQIGYIVGWALTLAYLKYYRAANYKYGASTLGDVFKNFWSPRIGRIVSIMIFIAFAGSISSSMVSISSILSSITGISMTVAYVITIIAITLISLLGGMGGLARLNIIHIIMLAISVIVIAICCIATANGGLGGLLSSAAADGKINFFGQGFGFPTVFSYWIAQPMVCVVSALSIAGTVGAKSLKVAKQAQTLMVVFAIIFFGCLAIVGLGGYYTYGLEGDNTLWYAVASKFGPLVAALASIGVLAASLSSAPTMVLMMGSVGMHDFVEPFSKKQFTEKQKIVTTRLLIIVFSVLFQLLGLFSTDLIRIISNAYSIWAVCGFVLTIALIWKRPNEKSAFWAMLIGTIFCAIWIFAGFFMEGNLLGISPQMIAAITSVVVLIAMTLVTSKPGPSENYMRYKVAKEELAKAIKEGKEAG